MLGVGSHIGIRAEVLLEAGLDEELLDLAVVDHGGVSPGALAEASLGGPGAAEAHGAGESSGTVGDELDVLEVAGVKGVGSIGLLLLEAQVETPLSHHESVVDTQAVDLINTEGLDLLCTSNTKVTVSHCPLLFNENATQAYRRQPRIREGGWNCTGG